MKGLILKWAGLLLAGLLLLGGCLRPLDAHTVVLDYDDFGPSALSFSLLGNAWWQWMPEGGGNPRTRFDVKVVVYKDVALDEVKAAYPVSAVAQRDFRYVSSADALTYLDGAIHETQGFEEGRAVMGRLQATRSRIQNALP